MFAFDNFYLISYSSTKQWPFIFLKEHILLNLKIQVERKGLSSYVIKWSGGVKCNGEVWGREVLC